MSAGRLSLLLAALNAIQLSGVASMESAKNLLLKATIVA